MSQADSPLILEVQPEESGQRIDRLLAARLPQFSRSRLSNWIRDGHITLCGAPIRPSLTVHGGEKIEVCPPPTPDCDLVAADIPLTMVHVDDHVIVVDKPAHIVVHPGSGNAEGTMVQALIHRFGALSPIGLPERPGIVHRIDAGTSGLLVVARTEIAHVRLAQQFADHSAHRRYRALVWDHGLAEQGSLHTDYARNPKDRRKFTTRISTGRHAVSHWVVRERLGPCAWVDLRLETGRTHQIRVHMSELGHPLVGDPWYGQRRRMDAPGPLRRLGFELGLGRQALHAAELGFAHPETGRLVTFESPVPNDIDEVIGALRSVYASPSDAP